MKNSSYIPDRGDAVWLNRNPQTGHEQAGRRPTLVLSSSSYNGKVGLLLACPISSRVKGFPFEVSIPPGHGVSGVILADHIKNLDYRSRQAEFICQLPASVLTEVLYKLETLLKR